MLYPSVEHAFQAAKTFDKKHRRAIQKEPKPAIAKVMGHGVELREDWDDVKIGVMSWLLRDKFYGTWPGSDDLQEFLRETSPHVLVEGNFHKDWFWGAVPSKDVKISNLPIWHDDDRDWYGENHLGRLLMELRDEILDEETKWQR